MKLVIDLFDFYHSLDPARDFIFPIIASITNKIAPNMTPPMMTMNAVKQLFKPTSFGRKLESIQIYTNLLNSISTNESLNFLRRNFRDAIQEIQFWR